MIEDHSKVVATAESINLKYIGMLIHLLAEMLMDHAIMVKVLEIKPKFVSTWDFVKA